MLRIAIESLRCIRKFHQLGYLHRDIKPGNFLIRNDPEYPICLIDFGLSSRYLDSNNLHIPFSEDAGFHGTCRYASLNAHNHFQLSRRDDLYSWFYTLMECSTGRLPWKGKADPEGTELAKRDMPITTLCDQMPSVFLRIYPIIQQLQYLEEPNYQGMINIIQESINAMGSVNLHFDWELVPEQENHEENMRPIRMVSHQPSRNEKSEKSIGCKVCNVA